MEHNAHYNEQYFAWQKQVGELTGIYGNQFYKDYIKLTDKVLDFGCGGGSLLAHLQCTERWGLEINENAIKHAQSKGVQVKSDIKDLPDNYFDVLISSHAFEHVDRPLDMLKELYSKLKPGGTIVIIVPNEKKWKYDPNDINQHLYTWSEMSLGNLAKRAGYSIVKVDEIVHKFLPGMIHVHRMFKYAITNFLSFFYARVFFNPISQIRVVAKK
jgi:2-polyprenyl-3-methyl-5-hydroxy-6-metoxy-1,4-benzoquinol methylase